MQYKRLKAWMNQYKRHRKGFDPALTAEMAYNQDSKYFRVEIQELRDISYVSGQKDYAGG